MQRRFIYIINPISGSADKKSVRDTIEEQTKKEGFEYFIYPSVASGDYSFLQPLIAEREITDVAIAGGDGTINQVVNSLKSYPVQFGIIPSGSGNGLAFSAGIPKNAGKALEIIFKGNSKPTDGFMVNKSFACMLCGFGFDAQVAHDFADAPKRGLLTYVKKTISNFISAPTYNFTLTNNEKKMKVEAFFISIANSNQFGNHFTIAPKASLNDGLLDIVIMTKQNKLSMLFQTLKQLGGYNQIKSFDLVNEHSSIIYLQTKQLKIENSDSAPMHIDGDPVESMKKIEIRILENAFRLIYP